MAAADSLHEPLQGSPYSLPDDPDSLALLEEMLPRAEALETRCQAVRVSLAESLARQVARATRASEVYESNAIEGKTVMCDLTTHVVSPSAISMARHAALLRR